MRVLDPEKPTRKGQAGDDGLMVLARELQVVHPQRPAPPAAAVAVAAGAGDGARAAVPGAFCRQRRLALDQVAV